MILHGASANKTGVICSSYEILAGLTLTDEEFLSIKDEYVAQVLGILRVRARSEAQLLLTEFKRTNGKVFLTELTREVSREINELGDRLAEELQGGPRIGTREDVRNLVLGYCPQVWEVGGMAMVDSVAGGVVYSRSPVNVRDRAVIIHAVWGLPKLVVDGKATPDRIEVSRPHPGERVAHPLAGDGAQNGKIYMPQGRGRCAGRTARRAD
ncbi:hypothetical protein LWC08_00005 [Desulfobaculum bizertense]|uniref:PEP/pyruvate-binding domain-containing protein n=1 Tax=Desulfobaculum bizertense TaxID=376490 RepID=UPI001F21F123|nr:PEP/pyruvate-binding domain-containing protein [Desulfobaculum bizertense]UIJ37995.1 hypothetical protein LWC08_00005 [Desulfobaculum bizertense]